MFIVVDEIHCIKCCELSSVIMTIHGSCLLGGCVYRLDFFIGVKLQ